MSPLPSPPPSPTRAPSPATSPVELVAAVDAAPLEAWPFVHVYLESILPAGSYRRLLEHLPAPRHYREFRHGQAMQPDGHSARRKFYLYPEHIRFLPAEQRQVWLPLAHLLRSREL